MRLLGLVCLLIGGAATAAPVAVGQESRAQIVAPVEVSLSRAEVSTQLGDSFRFRSKVTNAGAQPLSGLVAHLNVVGLSSGIYVDPEDWSSERTKNVPALRPGESTSISWSVTAVTGGHAAVYIVVLPGDDRSALEPPVASPAIDVRITEAKNLNSGGVLPLALGVPALLGGLTLAARRRRSR